MIRVLVFLALVVVLAFAGAWLVERQGDIVLTIDGRTIETSLTAGVGLVVALALGVMIVIGILRFLLRLPSSIGFAARARRRAKGFSAVSRGMVAVGAGDPRSAKRYADDAAKLLGDEPLTLLLKAQASQMAGDRPGAEGAFRRMLDEPETKVLGLRGLFVEARRKGDDAAARAYAAEAARLAPSVAWAGEALLEYQCAEADWMGALATLDRGARGLDKAAVRRQRAVLLTADGLARSEKESDVALARLQEAVKLAPTLVPAVAALARQLARRGEMRKASKVIEAAWPKSSHPDLAEAYVAVRPGDSARDRLSRAERLLSLTPREPEARIAVANAAYSAREFERARKVLAPLLEGRPPVRVCLLMADIAEEENADSGAIREWLARASRAPRDPAWIADGVIADSWSPVSPVTGRLDAFVWGTPVEQLTQGVDGEPAPRRRPVPLPPADTVLADVDEPPAAVLTEEAKPVIDAVAEPAPAAEVPAATPAPAEPAAPEAAAPVLKAEPVDPARVEPVKAEPAKVSAAAPVAAVEAVETKPRRPGPAPVVFPLPTPPDVPGPDQVDGTGRRFLQ